MEGPRAAVTSFHPPVSAQKAKNRAASQPEPPTAVHPSLTSMQIPQRVLFLSFLVFFFFLAQYNGDYILLATYSVAFSCSG